MAQVLPARGINKVILAAYCPHNKQAVFSLDGGKREDGSALLDVSLLGSTPVATWVSFINNNEDVADSVFAGMV